MSNYKDEKLQILKMIEEGKITSQEGIDLLEALEDTQEKNIENIKAKWVKIRVYDAEENTKVNVNLPISLIDAGIKLANKISPDLKVSGISEEDLKGIIEAIKNGAEGKIVDVESENGQRVEITVE